MKCIDCPYSWIDDGERFPTCHYHYDDGYAPCEVSEQIDESEDDE